MGIIVEKPKIGARDKRANFYRAYTGNPTDGSTVTICDGKPGETAGDVRNRAIEMLTLATERQALHVRAVSPGQDGAAADVWILSGDPMRGYHYGRVFACGHAPGLGSGEGRPTLQAGTVCGNAQDEIAILTAFLTHMADCYPENLWPQFLWSNAYRPWCGRSSVDIEAIKVEIRTLNLRRAEMTSTHAP